MFENLTDKLQRVFKNLRGQGKLTQEHVDEALDGIREALLEGDVNVGVIDEVLTLSAPKSCCNFLPTSRSSKLCAMSWRSCSANTPSRSSPRARLRCG